MMISFKLLNVVVFSIYFLNIIWVGHSLLIKD